jgi:MOSC domain-containing protein YiiM
MSEVNVSASGKIISVCVSKAKVMTRHGQEVLTGIFKEPVLEKIQLRELNLDGDEQADLTVHGGVDKAIYLYPSEHYPFWHKELPETDLPFGAFGENLTTVGLLEDSVFIGDEFRMGTAVVRVSQPRLPCYKLAIRLGRTDIIKRFMLSGRSGIYFSVVSEGILGTGDDIIYLKSDEHKITVGEVAKLFTASSLDLNQIKRILNSNLADQMKLSVQSLVRKMR